MYKRQGVIILISEECTPLYNKFHHRFPKLGNSWGYRAFQVIRTFLMMCCIRLFDTYASVRGAIRQFIHMFTRFDLSKVTGKELLDLGLSLIHISLPQAPQQYKQLLMVSGFDKYFQIAPCFRDEDARADRSPGEFYQLDFEMSFATQEDVFRVGEEVLSATFEKFAPEGAEVTQAPYPIISYKQAMLEFGTDKPDLRNPLRIVDVTDFFQRCTFKPFHGKTVRAINVHALSLIHIYRSAAHRIRKSGRGC